MNLFYYTEDIDNVDNLIQYFKSDLNDVTKDIPTLIQLITLKVGAHAYFLREQDIVLVWNQMSYFGY